MSKNLTIQCAVYPKDYIEVDAKPEGSYLYMSIVWPQEDMRVSICLDREDARSLAQHILKTFKYE